MNVDRIVIVGGGSAGWISASYLIKTFPEKDIVLIESPDIPTVGVGESTLADFTNFRDYLGINEKDFMVYTDASYKMSIKFNDFYDVDSGGFHYPFREPDLTDTNYGIRDWLDIKAFYPQTPNKDFVNCYFPQSYLFENNKFATNESGLYGTYNKTTDVAYHFNAVKFASFLKETYAMPRGVKNILAKVVQVEIDDDGIKYILLDNGDKITSDLFIDCTGFSSLLLGKSLKEPFISYSDMLPNNRSWAVQIPYKDKELELEPFTNCTAIKNGWCWNTPLFSRIGTGYVYSDKFVSPDDALDEFKQYLMSEKMVIPRTKEDLDALQFRDIQMKIGIYERTFVKNVVAIGLSAGFVEPLESNGLFSVIRFISKLSKTILRGTVSKFDIDIYNITIKGMYDTFAEFVALHYALSIRRDSEYWIAISKKTFSNKMVNMEPGYIAGFNDVHDKKMFIKEIDPIAGITYISVGMNYHFIDRIDQQENIFNNDIKPYIDGIKEKFEDKKKYWQEISEHAPTLYKYLKDNIYN